MELDVSLTKKGEAHARTLVEDMSDKKADDKNKGEQILVLRSPIKLRVHAEGRRKWGIW